MALRYWTRSIKGADDVELGIPRSSELIYHCTAPKSGPASGLVFVIPGLGEDASGEDQCGLRAYLTEEYGLLAVTVEYHCYRSRPNIGATLSFTEVEFQKLQAVCAKHDIRVTTLDDVKDALLRLPERYLFDLRLMPPNGDYHNFGVMQALDHLLALSDLDKSEEIDFDAENIIAIGTSYGGYIAHMIAKIAPNTLRAVIENSAYITPLLLNSAGKVQFGPGLSVIYNLARVDFYVDTRWTVGDKNLPSHYSVGRHAIRDLAFPAHVYATMAASRRTCQFRMLHSVLDAEQPIERRRNQVELLRATGFDAVLKEASEEVEQQRVGKQLERDRNTSLRTMFDNYYPTLSPKPGKLDAELGSDVAYLCGDMIYSFGHGRWGCLMHVEKLQMQRKSYRPPSGNWRIDD